MSSHRKAHDVPPLSNPRPRQKRRTEVPSISPVPTPTSLEACANEFRLLAPKPFDAWAMYLAQRRAAGGILQRALASFEDEYEDDGEPHGIIQLAVDKVLQRTQFDAAGAQAMRECVVPLWPDVVGDGGIVREARILSRIYSPTNPAAIDVHLNYWTRTRWTYCEFWFTVYYRLHPVISTERVDTSTPQGFDEMNDFRVLFEIALKDIPPGPKWRAVEKRKFHIDSSDACVIHELLFGRQRANERMISVKETLCLLLGSVGISFRAAVDPKDEVDLDQFCGRGLSRNSARWLGKNIRRVSGEAVERDKQDEQDWDEDPEDSDEDSDEDEDE